jgi:hypothetical protein
LSVSRAVLINMWMIKPGKSKNSIKAVRFGGESFCVNVCMVKWNIV